MIMVFFMVMVSLKEFARMNGIVFRLREHTERLYESAKYVRLRIPATKEAMVQIVVETLRKNELRHAYV
jgi:branched-chain amino acid aminotransferase